MTKNITVGVSDEIGTRMEKFTDVNWTGVARDCIERYLDDRENVEVGATLLQKLRKEKGELYAQGAAWAKGELEREGYRKVASAWRSFDRTWGDKMKQLPQDEDVPDWEVLDIFEDSMRQWSLLPKTDPTEDFLKGMRETLERLMKAI